MNNAKDKIEVEATYDVVNNTYNVMTLDKECLFFGTSEDVDEWLFMHRETHIDVSGVREWD